MALHEQSVGATDEWYTPPHIFEALGCRFDLDVASPGLCNVPWVPTSRAHICNSLTKEWFGFIWMNPPFGARNGLVPWLERFFQHGNGIALVPDRTSAPWWQTYTPRADIILFCAPKIRFIGRDGRPGRSPAQGTCLLAVGPQAVEALYRAAARGAGVIMKAVPNS